MPKPPAPTITPGRLDAQAFLSLKEACDAANELGYATGWPARTVHASADAHRHRPPRPAPPSRQMQEGRRQDVPRPPTSPAPPTGLPSSTCAGR